MTRLILRYVLFLLGVGFIAVLIWHSRNEIDALLTTTQWPLFILSVLVGSTGYIASGTFFKELLHKYAVEVDSTQSRRMLVYSQMIKYIPGRVWVLLYQASLLKGVRFSEAVFFANMDFLIMSIVLVASVSISLLFLPFDSPLAFIFLTVGLLPFMACAKYCYLSSTIRRLLSFFKKSPFLDNHCQYSANYTRTFLFYLFYSITYTVSHILMMRSIFGFSFSQSTDYIAYLGLGWVVGALSMLVPGGIGVKELVFVIMAKSATESPDLVMLTTIAVISRVWTILLEVTAVALLYLVEKFRLIR